MDYFQARLHLPCDELVPKVLKLFKVYLHQLMPNAIVQLCLFAWVASSEGVKASARASVAAHKPHHLPKSVFTSSVQSEAHYSCVNFTYCAGLTMLVVAYNMVVTAAWRGAAIYHRHNFTAHNTWRGDAIHVANEHIII